MSFNKINIGQQANDGTGDSIRTAFDKANAMFQELYGLNNGGRGISFTNFYDTPKKLRASTTSSPIVFTTDFLGNTVTQRTLVGGQNIVVINSATSDQIVISSPYARLSSDTNPTLGGNLNGNFYKGINFSDPTNPHDLATKEYVDSNSPYSITNLYVSTNGYKSFPATIAQNKWGRSLAYSFRYINDACQWAEKIINSSTITLSSYQQYITFNNGLTTATVYATLQSPSIPGATRVLLDYAGAGAQGSDQYLSGNIRPGQYLLGLDTGVIGFIETFGQAKSVGVSNYNSATFARDTGFIVDAIALDLAWPTANKSQSTFVGLQYYIQSTATSSVLSGSIYTATQAVQYLQSIIGYITTGSTAWTPFSNGSQIVAGGIGDAAAATIVSNDLGVIANIINSGTNNIVDKIIPNGINATVATNLVNAFSQIQQNRSFLQQEVLSYVKFVTSGTTYSYNTTTFATDIGYMLDSVCFDLLHPQYTTPSNRQAIQAGAYQYGYTTASINPYESPEIIAAYQYINTLTNYIITNTPVPNPYQSAVSQYIGGTAGGVGDVLNAANAVNNITNIILNGPTVAASPSFISLTENMSALPAAVLVEQNRSFIQAELIAFINSSVATYEYYDVIIGNGTAPQGTQYQSQTSNPLTGLSYGEPLLFAYAIPTQTITILIESGVYEEQYPIRVPANVSIKGDEVRRVIVKPAPLTSTSPSAKLFFRRDSMVDGLTYNSPDNAGQNLAIIGQEYGYHYLTDPSDPTSPPRLNSDMDVFLLNDTNILTGLTAQGHGGFMCVFDPEGQILTKSPYIYKATSFSQSINKQRFAGGMLVDGFAGNLQVVPTDTSTYFLGTTTINVSSPSAISGLYVRQPQTPTSFYVGGNRYQVVYLTNYSSVHGTATLNLNPTTVFGGGIAVANGTITITSGQGGTYYRSPPNVYFSAPNISGGHTAEGSAVLSNVTTGTVTSVMITNPGSGYTGPVKVTYQFGNPDTPATPFTISTTSLAIGFIGQFKNTIELNTPGNKSMLCADFTQMNDLGYGLQAANNGIIEAVSVFSYYGHTAYYARQGGSIRSLNGSNAFGDYAMKAEGSDPNEVPIPILLQRDIVTTATVVSWDWSALNGGLNTVNTTGGITIYVRNPFNLSQGMAYPDMSTYVNGAIDINYGTIPDASGTPLGLVTYNVASASTVSNIVTNAGGWLIRLSIGASQVASGLGGAGANGLAAPINTGTIVTLRSQQQLSFSGMNRVNLLDANLAALQLGESTSTSYPIAYINDLNGPTSGAVNILLSGSYNYIPLTIWNNVGYQATTGLTSIRVQPLSTSTGAPGARLLQNLSITPVNTQTQYTFAWNGTIHRVTGYVYSVNNSTYDTITFTPGLNSTVINNAITGSGGNAYSVTLNAGIRYLASANIYSRISTLRASGHDLFNIGTGGYDDSRYPNDIYGPSINLPIVANQRVEVGTGRVFAVSTDQDGNFTIGPFFQVNQASGSVTINAALTLSKLAGISFQKGGLLVDEFTADDTLSEGSSSVVPVETAIIGYINHRLGLTPTNQFASRIGSGYLDLGGLQDMAGNITLNGNNINMGPRLSVRGNIAGTIINLTTTTTGGNVLDAINKGYADNKIAIAGTSAVDSATGQIQPQFGEMTGPLILSADPAAGDNRLRAATKGYVDGRTQFSMLPDVSLTSPSDQDLVMFNATAVSVNINGTYVVCCAARQVTNVTLCTSPTANTCASSAGGSDVSFTRSSNSLNIKLVSGALTDYHINSSACIKQSKLCMKAADTLSSAPSGACQSVLGLAQFDSTYFSAAYGWISLCTGAIDANSAKKVDHCLSPGSYISGGCYNGSCDCTWSVNAAALVATRCTIMARDGSGNTCACCIFANCFIGNVCGNVCGNISGNAAGSSGCTVGTLSAGSYICGGSYNGSCNYTWSVNACTGASSCTIVARDSACGITAKGGCFDSIAVGGCALPASGCIIVSGNVTAYSDCRLKTNICRIENALCKVKQLNGYTYTRCDTGIRQTGLMAQELIKVLEEAVGGSEDTVLTVAYGNVVGLLVEAIKDLSDEIEELKKSNKRF